MRFSEWYRRKKYRIQFEHKSSSDDVGRVRTGRHGTLSEFWCAAFSARDTGRPREKHETRRLAPFISQGHVVSRLLSGKRNRSGLWFQSLNSFVFRRTRRQPWIFMLSSPFLSRGIRWLTSENGLAFTFGKWTNTVKRRTFPYENVEEAIVIKRGI